MNHQENHNKFPEYRWVQDRIDDLRRTKRHLEVLIDEMQSTDYPFHPFLLTHYSPFYFSRIFEVTSAFCSRIYWFIASILEITLRKTKSS